MAPSPALSAEGGPASSGKAYVYMLHSRGRYYTGWTIDMMGRVREHNQGLTPSTRSWRPWALLGFEEWPTRAEAIARERALKRNPRMLRYFKKRLTEQAALRAEGR